MSIIGIVCEFNPFHKGHKHLIDSVKQQGDIVVCVMSGNYVQRGEPAIFPKDIRVEMALKNGADVALSQTWDFISSQHPGPGTENFSEVAHEINRIKQKEKKAQNP